MDGMKLETNLLGRLHNTPLPVTCGLLPLFEAIVNSIHAIEDRSSVAEGKIKIEIMRKAKQGQLNLDGGKRKGPEARKTSSAFVSPIMASASMMRTCFHFALSPLIARWLVAGGALEDCYG